MLIRWIVIIGERIKGTELDLLIHRNGKRSGYEIKYTSAPKLTKSMQIAMNDLKLDSLTVVYPGEIDYPLTEKIRVLAFKSLAQSISPDGQ